MNGNESASFLTLEKVLFLKSVSMFSEIPEESLVEVATLIEELEIKRGEPIFRQGEFGTSMFIIVEGKVRVEDKAQELGVLGEREFFGELAALDPIPRSATVTAIEDCYLFRMDQSLLYDLMTRHVDVARGVLRVLCKRIRDCDTLIRDLSDTLSVALNAQDRYVVEGVTCELGLSGVRPVVNLSLGGFFVATDQPPTSGEIVETRLFLPRDVTVPTLGRVAWVNAGGSTSPLVPGPGCGIQNIRMTPQGRQALIAALRTFRRPPARLPLGLDAPTRQGPGT